MPFRHRNGIALQSEWMRNTPAIQTRDLLSVIEVVEVRKLIEVVKIIEIRKLIEIGELIEVLEG